AGGETRQRIRWVRHDDRSGGEQERAGKIRRPDQGRSAQLYRATDPVPVHGADPGGQSPGAAPRGPAAVHSQQRQHQRHHGRPHPRCTAQRFAGGEFIPGWWQQRHLDRGGGQVMLARVAEALFWMSRYLERAENMARLINVNANLLLDIPKKTTLGWEPLIDITGTRDVYLQQNDNFDERTVLKYLVSDASSPVSIANSLSYARENARTIRDVIPREAWEQINALNYFAKDQLASGLSKRGRFSYLKEIILRNQTITGLLAGTMNQDQGYLFIRMGRNLERADMTSRIVDVRTANLLTGENLELRPFENIQWMSVLKSLTAYQMYRQAMQ